MKMKNALNILRDQTSMVSVDEVENIIVRNLLEKLPPAIRNNYSLSKAQLKRLESQLRNMKHGALSKSALSCKGSECPMKSDCLFIDQNMAPIGYPCPYELAFIEMMQEHLIEELHIKDGNLIELHMLSDLIQAELFDMRATQAIAKDGLFNEQPIAVTPTGEVLTRKEESVALQISDKLKRRKERIRQQFLATRESQAKFLKKHPNTPDAASANLVKKFSVLVEEGNDNAT